MAVLEILRRRVGGYADAEVRVRVGWRVEGIEGGCGERGWQRGGEGVGTVYRGGEWAAQLCQVAVRDRVRARDVAGVASCDGCRVPFRGAWVHGYEFHARSRALWAHCEDHGRGELAGELWLSGEPGFEEIDRALPEKVKKMPPRPRLLRYRIQRIAPYKAQ